MQRSTVVPIVLVVSAVYGATAVLCYLLHAAAHPLTISAALPFVGSVVAPYSLLFAGYYFSRDRLSFRVMTVVIVLSSLAAGFLYADSFRSTVIADMYVLIYLFLPLLQAVAALVALLVVIYRAKRVNRSASI
jgi:hypothetical protein